MARQVGEPRSEPSGGTIELFGYWQTEAYVPPAAVDGIVPKSDKGTVELLSEHMLPRGCTHIARPRAGAGVVTREAKGGGQDADSDLIYFYFRTSKKSKFQY